MGCINVQLKTIKSIIPYSRVSSKPVNQHMQPWMQSSISSWVTRCNRTECVTMFKCYFQAVWLFFPHSLLWEGHSATHSHKAGGKPGLVVAHLPPTTSPAPEHLEHGSHPQLWRPAPALPLWHGPTEPLHAQHVLTVCTGEREKLKVRHDKNSKEWQHAHEVWRSHTSTYANTRTTPHKHMIEQIRNSEIWSVQYSTAHKCKQQ